MTPEQFKAAGIKLFGRKGWHSRLAQALGVNPATIFRMCRKEIVPGPYAVAISGLLEQHKRQAEIDRAARKLLPRKFRTRKTRHGKPIPQKIVVRREDA